MIVSFYSSRIQFSGDTLEKHGLGGSESALINITTSWKKQFPNDEIVVFNGNNLRSEEYNGIIYKSIIEYRTNIISTKYDAFISLRELNPFLNNFINAKLKCFWSEDDMQESDLIKLKNNLYARSNVDLFFAISNHSKIDIQNSFPEKEVLLQRNGYRSDWIQNKKIDNKNPVCLYGSTPFRGLSILANCWKEIYEKCVIKGVKPTLKVCSGMSLYQQPESDFIELYNYLKSLPNVIFLGAIPQKELYKELNHSSVLLYSCNWTETGCMICTESLANGMWVVTTDDSDYGAISEQVKNGVNGYLIKGNANSEEYKKEFIEKSIDSIVNPKTPVSEGLVFSWDEQSELMRKSIEERIK